MTIDGSGSHDAWQRECLIEVTDGTTIMTLHGLTETVDIDIGEREVDVLNLVNLGQIMKFGSVGMSTITFEGYCLEAGSIAAGAATGFWDFFASRPGIDAAEPQSISISNTATRFRVTVLWTDEVAATSASEEIASGSKCRRFVIAECACTGCKDSFTDGILKSTLTFKGAAFDNGGSAVIKMESKDGTGDALAALGAYTPGSVYWA